MTELTGSLGQKTLTAVLLGLAWMLSSIHDFKTKRAIKKAILVTGMALLFCAPCMAQDSVRMLPRPVSPLVSETISAVDQGLYVVKTQALKKDGQINWVSDFLFINAITFGIVSRQGAVQDGILSNPSLNRYRNNLKGLTWYDHDQWSAEMIHPGVGVALWAWYRARGYSRTEAFLTIYSIGLSREWLIKGWGITPSLDDPFMFSISGYVIGGLICEDVLGINWSDKKFLSDAVVVVPFFSTESGTQQGSVGGPGQADQSKARAIRYGISIYY